MPISSANTDANIECLGSIARHFSKRIKHAAPNPVAVAVYKALLLDTSIAASGRYQKAQKWAPQLAASGNDCLAYGVQ